MNHVMIDIETLGTNPNAPIASIGATFFNPATGELGEQFYCRVDFENDMLNGAVPDGATIKWWLRQSSDARAELICDDADAVIVFRAVRDLNDWLTDNADNLKSLKVWANSPSFDLVIMKSKFERLDLDIPWKYWNEQDVRTVKEVGRALGVDVSPFTGTRHNALHDAVNQAALVSSVMSRLVQNNGGESVMRDHQ
ncbi:3'-5' exonuclease [Pectobacterium brasiliense]|uniref:3'-5' exonuclease n=1 Tax=Pectobacterium brasiliense TaxID=180957 RepID=UPI001968AAFD|nr:3'-5' exonuclease [Pectobacterium brasiliense]MBN3265401.1 3'-5' exoribonuclease [Pectobacterium brasiliense]